MYRQGLGDCFVLALPAKGGTTKYVLIDCGVHARQTNGPARLTQVMEHLVASIGSHIDVVVATHEHADHLSGFVQKNSPFLKKDLTIGELWVAWTEKRGDGQADKLRKKRGTAQRLIDRAVEDLEQRAGVAATARAERLKGLGDFSRPAEGSVDEADVANTIAALGAGARPVTGSGTEEMTAPALGVAKPGKKTVKPSSNELALGLLAVKAGDSKVAYCEPGQTKEIAGVDNLRAYVLGPPRSDLLEKEKPSKIRGATEDTPGGAYKEVYLTAAGTNRALELSPRLGLEASVTGGALPNDWRIPFPESFFRGCQFSAPVGVGDDKRWHKGAPPERTRTLVESTYFAPDAAWRRVDDDWLGAAEPLAIDLVGDTNNSSLVLAFEWGAPGSGLVLLFPADAQVGNWLSWRDQTYGGSRKMKADDLLARTLLYKVGHHGSHNATVRRDPRDTSSPDPLGAPFGLELMNDIIAMIPVDWDAARKHMPDPWKMPHEPLYRRLREKTQRRILRSDLELTPLARGRDDDDKLPASKEWQPVPGLDGVRWRCSADTFTAGTGGPLCYDVAITLRPDPTP